MFAPPKKKIKFDNTPVSNYESFLYVNNSMNRLNLAHTFKMSFKIRQENGYTADILSRIGFPMKYTFQSLHTTKLHSNNLKFGFWIGLRSLRRFLHCNAVVRKDSAAVKSG